MCTHLTFHPFLSWGFFVTIFTIGFSRGTSLAIIVSAISISANIQHHHVYLFCKQTLFHVILGLVELNAIKIADTTRDPHAYFYSLGKLKTQEQTEKDYSQVFSYNMASLPSRRKLRTNIFPEASKASKLVKKTTQTHFSWLCLFVSESS